MRILIINPNTSLEITDEIHKSARKYSRPDTIIETTCPRKGPRSIESAYEEDLSAEGVLEKVIEGNKNKFDAIIIACYGDPHLHGAREISNIPVYGIAESSMHLACMLGYKFSIITVSERSRPSFEELVMKIGLTSKCASIRSLEIPVLEIQNSEKVINAMILTAKRAIQEDGAEVICLGCASMSGLDKHVEREVGVPVLDGVVCAIKIAESLYEYQLKLSKVKAFAMPEPKEFVGMDQFEITNL